MAIRFNEENHTYTSETGENFCSVTKLIEKYTPPYDADYWSTYKALKAVLSRHGIWEKYKKIAGGWNNVVTFARHIDTDFKYRKEVVMEKKLILKSWDDKKKDALDKGSEYHDMMERKVIEELGGTHTIKGTRPDIIGTPDFSIDALYPELLIYNETWRVAGQADLVTQTGKRVDILDYKTSEKIEKKSFMNQCLIGPLSSLPNANFYKYSIQLSIYACMLEEAGYEIGDLIIEHVDKNSFKTIDIYPVAYHRDEVHELIKEYAGVIREEIW